MAFIPKETPTGVIDGVNNVFTLLNDVDYITSLYVDGAIYVDFTLSGNIVTLTDAPTTSIFIDYYTTDSIIPIETNKKLGDVKTKIWRLLGQRSSSVNFSSDVLTDEINDFMSDVWRGKVINMLTKKHLISGPMFFQTNYYSFRISKDSVVTSDVSIGDTSIDMVTTGMNGAGWVMIGGDYIQYTSTTATSIEGVSGITTTHKEGVIVKQLYAFPINYDIIDEMDEVSYNYGGVSYTPIDIDSGCVSYDIIRVGGVPLMQIKGLGYDTIIRTKYIKKYVELSDDNEDFPLPDNYGTSMVAYIIAGNLAYEKMMMQGERLLNRGYDSLLTMWSFYNKKAESKNKIRPKPYRKIGRASR